MKAHTVTKVEETDRFAVVHIDRPQGVDCCDAGSADALPEGAQCAQTAKWRDLSMRNVALKLRYRPSDGMPPVRSEGEDFPWADPWARRVTKALSNAGARLELSWQGTARQYGLNWKSVATIVKRGWSMACATGAAAGVVVAWMR